MQKIKLQTTDDLKRVEEFEPEHARRILASPGASWEKAPKDAKVTDIRIYPGDETEVVTEVKTATVENKVA